MGLQITAVLPVNIIIEIIAFVSEVFVERIVSFGVMNKHETKISAFEKQVANSEIQIAINVNPFVITQNAESYSERDINQHIANTPEVAKEMPIVAIIPYIVMVKNYRPYGESFYYVPIYRVIRVETAKPV